MTVYQKLSGLFSYEKNIEQSSANTLDSLIKNPPVGVNLYSGGDILQVQNTLGIEMTGKLIDRIVHEEKPVLVFDIDGTLMEGGLEVGTKKEKTVSQYIADNYNEIEKFREKLKKMKNLYGGEVIICTGRGRVFAQMISDVFFGKGLVDKIICEGGGMIIDHGSIISYQNIDINKIYVTNSNSAVDINPQGIDKLIAMQHEVKDGVIAYFGDADNDRSAMEHFADINITPSNASSELVNEVVMQSGNSPEKRSALGVHTDERELYGVNKGIDTISQLYESAVKNRFVSGLTQRIEQSISKIVSIEVTDPYVSYIGLLHSLHGTSSLEQKNQPFYDKIFYRAGDISGTQQDGYVINLPRNSFVRLNEKIAAPGLPTVNDLRAGKEKGVLFSGVAAIKIQTDDGIRIPLLQRDEGAPTDPNKYTLPAGRADKLPGQVAYEELIEELVIFGNRDGKMVQIIPELPGASREKIHILATVARDMYIKSLISHGIDLMDVLPYLQADFLYIPLTVSSGGTNVVTNVIDENQKIESVTEGGFFPLDDKLVNTYEMIRGFQLDLTGFTKISVGDGDGFGRDASLFTLEELSRLTDDDIVSSLKHVIQQELFTK